MSEMIKKHREYERVRESERVRVRKKHRKGRSWQYEVKGKNRFYEMSFELVVGVLV